MTSRFAAAGHRPHRVDRADAPAANVRTAAAPQAAARSDGADAAGRASRRARRRAAAQVPARARGTSSGALPPRCIPLAALRPADDRLLRLDAGRSRSRSTRSCWRSASSRSTSRRCSTAGRRSRSRWSTPRSKAKPTKADILAQANLDGGGNTDADRRAKTPLPVLPKDSRATEVTRRHAEGRDARAAGEGAADAAQERAGRAAAQPKPTEATEQSELPTANELMQRTLEAMRLEAQIAKDMDAYQKRPKRRFVGARAEEYRFARYVEDWRLKIERVGNLNYPEAARQLKLYGSLLLTVSIRADGSVESVEINRSSGQRVLDAAAVKIVEMSAPFAPFPPDIRRDTDILHITRTWTFTKGDELRSE